MRKGQSFDEAVVAMIKDLPWQSEQAAVFRQEYPEPTMGPTAPDPAIAALVSEAASIAPGPLGSEAARGPVKTRARARSREWTHPTG